MSIGEFARRVGLSISAVRFYGDRGLLVPSSIDRSNGYRRYDDEQVAVGVLIRDLRRMNMSLVEIESALALGDHDRGELVRAHLRKLEDILCDAHNIAESLGAQSVSTRLQPQEVSMSTATLRSRDFARGLDQVLVAAGTDPHHPNWMCILIEGKEGSVRLAATDSHRLAIRDLVPSDIEAEFSAVVAAATLKKWVAKLEAADEIELRVGRKELTVRGDEVDLRCAVLPTAFPPYEEILVPSEDRTNVLVDRQLLLHGLESFDDQGAVLLSATSGGLHLIRRDLNYHIDAGQDGPECHVAIDPEYGADAVRHAVGAEVVIEVDADPVQPVVFRSADDGTYTSLLMPVKLV